MLALLMIIGVVLLLASVLAFGSSFFKSPGKTEKQQKFNRIGEPIYELRGEERVPLTETVTTGATPEWFNKLASRKMASLFFIIGLFLVLTKFLFFWSEQGYQYVLVYPWGTKSMVSTEGIKIRGFAQVWEWQKFIDVKVANEGDNGYDEIEGVLDSIDIRFIDQVRGKGIVSTRFQLPTDKDSFIELAVRFRTMENLVNNTLIPTVREQFNNTAYMFAAQDYISGSAQNFRQTFDEVLKGGTYVVRKETLVDTLFGEIQSDKRREIREIQTSYKVEKVEDENGIPKRISHEITTNNIIVSQVIVDNVILEQAFRKRLEAQRDEAAKRQLAQQQVETAKADQQKIIAQGERDKSAEKVAEELKQVAVLITKETQREEERTNKELAQIQLETAQINAKKIRVNAEAKRIELQIADGLSAGEKFRIEKEVETRIGVAGKIAGPNGMQWPNFYMNGASGGTKGQSSSDALTQIMTMMLAQDFKRVGKK